MYILFILIVWAEQSQCPLTESSAADRVTTSPADTVTAGRAVSAYRYHQCVEWMEMYICGYIHLIRVFILWVWPPLLALTILYYTHKMDIHILTTIFYTIILCLMIFIHYEVHSLYV